MIGDSFPEYVFIRFSIFCLRSIAPLSILYIILSWYHHCFLYSWWLGLYATAEAAFYLLVYLPRSRLLQKPASHPPLPTREEREALFEKCFSRVRDSQKAYGWFFSTAPDGIKRDNMIEWLLWAIFGTHREGLKDEWAEELQGYLRKMESLFGHEMEDGWDQTVRCMKITLDPVDMIHRPLLWYFIVTIVDTITAIQLMHRGFRHYTSSQCIAYFPPRTFTAFSNASPHPDLIYWLRPHRSATKDPVLFLHGIGIGLWPYVPFFADLIEADPDVGIIALENLSISMRISRPPLTRAEMLQAITELLDAHNIPRVIVAAHSYGTVIAAHMLREPALAARVSAWLLVDPVPFLLHMPAVAYNFVYRAPRTANEWQLWYFASRDPDIARALARHFFWSQNILWKEDLEGKEVAVVLCGKDQIVDAAEVRRYLTGDDDSDMQFLWKKDGLEVLFYPELDHATVFDTAQRRRPMVDIIKRFHGRARSD
ncbi:Alpha/Beta hydrolase protein [Cubamyces lactineus]|nr:Alpha/Beta hydrolase protein [Cubamyces lactineus]